MSIVYKYRPLLIVFSFVGHVTASEYEGGSQASWTDKIMSMKGQDEKALNQPEGVDEDEWDD